MQKTSTLYKEILSGRWKAETRLVVGDGSPDNGYGSGDLVSLSTVRKVFQSTPAVGCCVAGEIDIQMRFPLTPIPRQAKLTPYVRITNGKDTSEWIKKGVYYVDTRNTTDDGSSTKIITLHGYDDMLKSEQDYPSSTLDWPAKDIDVVQEIAAFMGVELDQRTVEKMTNGYTVPLPTDYSCREVLGYIAVMYGGCWVMSDLGELLLIVLGDIPDFPEESVTGLLADEQGRYITFGGDCICLTT